MTINKINVFGGYESQRLEHLEQQKKEAHKNAPVESGTDKISISDEGRLQANIIKAAHEGDDIRQDVVAKIKAQIEAGEYKPDSKDIAANLVRQELDIWG
ncbi:MAG: flagellar biosynthesis anti-sigma factor FlgM [Desulfovibrionales bacterium]|nr:flagellar biosynthesis anti-sigma factor FlgM [Desulfovibrionales bacterium]